MEKMAQKDQQDLEETCSCLSSCRIRCCTPCSC